MRVRPDTKAVAVRAPVVVAKAAVLTVALTGEAKAVGLKVAAAKAAAMAAAMLAEGMKVVVAVALQQTGMVLLLPLPTPSRQSLRG